MKLHKLQNQVQHVILSGGKTSQVVMNAVVGAQVLEDACDDVSFLSAVTHELKTPLASIIGFADLLKNEIRNPNSIEECASYVDEIAEAADDLNSLVQDLLDIGQSSSKNFSVDLSKEIDAIDVIKKVLRLNYNYALSKRISLKFDDSKNVKAINLDAKRMKQILMNLVSNSIKYSKAGMDVNVSAAMEDNFLKISISDQGFGMTSEQVKIAFEKYGTVANENSDAVDSLGLGLPITKQLVELQNGIIEVRSDLGVGTEMIIKFPYQQHQM